MDFRKEPSLNDIPYLVEILRSTGFFYDYEIDIVIELVEDRVPKGKEKSDYIFDIAEINHIPIAFTCYGKTPGTLFSFDLYWIAVHQNYRGQGVGKKLMNRAFNDIKFFGGKNIWIETSSRELYTPTRNFYLRYGCQLVAELPNFYNDNDHKVVFLKKINPD